ncbi:hypothetical protein GYMLUDRAFT_243530 [Collybiopsis luxurians FD-317 M1]|uniref:Fungal-type protein kinase domain-containing protein n=1 Tax=Collybiopsis luxurians FD-317 M1 TaxID=944289 RepID=A0A0D0CFI0_9AGAR|nr:hypothetical protein GYMLUDRAFT_243530 [Collybiopsis luxurians FD-317 M1]
MVQGGCSGGAQKKAEESIAARNDNIAKIIYSLQHVLALDPCRRFTFGVKMQNRQLRVWIACRGVLRTTKPYDYLKDCKGLVRLFIAFAFFSPTALGWDATIKCINAPDLSKGEKRQYETKISDKVFTTLATLADYAAESFISRATRVWLVKDGNGKEYVLKDVWLDEDRPPEHEIRKALLSDVKRVCGEEDLERFKRHMLTPLCFERVQVDGRVDTTNGMMNGKVPFNFSPSPLKIVQPTNYDVAAPM